MGCAINHDSSGNQLHWCGEGIEPCNECCRCADYLCDFPIGDGKTCDHALCDTHAHPIADNRHLCSIHLAIFRSTGALVPIRIDRISLSEEQDENNYSVVTT